MTAKKELGLLCFLRSESILSLGNDKRITNQCEKMVDAKEKKWYKHKRFEDLYIRIYGEKKKTSKKSTESGNKKTIELLKKIKRTISDIQHWIWHMAQSITLMLSQ